MPAEARTHFANGIGTLAEEIGVGGTEYRSGHQSGFSRALFHDGPDGYGYYIYD